MDGTRIYLVGEAGSGTHHARGVTLSTGAVAWSYQHTATGGDELWSVATNGKQVFVAGDVSSYSSGASLRALYASNGYDEANEGGTGADTTGSAWDLSPGWEVTANQCLATDGRCLFVGYASGAVRQLEVRGCADGTVTASLSFAGSVVAVAVDQDHVLVANSASPYKIWAYDKQTLAPVWSFLNSAAGAPAPEAVASDGCAVFCGFTHTVLSRTLTRLYRGNRPGLWRRVDPDEDFLPYRQQIIPHQ
jgi:hypothetical protein